MRPKYVYQTCNNIIVALFPDDLDYKKSQMPPEYSWYLSDVEVPLLSVVLEDGTLRVPELPPPPPALSVPMTHNPDWIKVVQAMDKRDPLTSAILQLISAKIEQNSVVAESALTQIRHIVKEEREGKGNG